MRVIDSHTGGEPTRVVVAGGPDLGSGSMLARKQRFETQYDRWRTAIACEPRGNDVVVGALLTPPENEGSLCGVIFFNNVGYLGMCGHGTVGVAVSLAYLSALGERCWMHGSDHLPSHFVLDTPVGSVPVDTHPDGSATIQNVPSYRFRRSVEVQLNNSQSVHGDVAWGGNWFFLCEDHGLAIDVANISQLHDFSKRVRHALLAHSITGEQGAQIDHIELFGAPSDPRKFDSRNFVLCPGEAYDRSPCGTGTSAKLACLAADGKLAPGSIWRQESVVGSKFEASYALAADGKILPRITGTAYLTADSQLLIDSNDPFAHGIRE